MIKEKPQQDLGWCIGLLTASGEGEVGPEEHKHEARQADGAGLARNASSGRGDRAGREERLQFRGHYGDSVSF